jgi:hypothetical protein
VKLLLQNAQALCRTLESAAGLLCRMSQTAKAAAKLITMSIMLSIFIRFHHHHD